MLLLQVLLRLNETTNKLYLKVRDNKGAIAAIFTVIMETEFYELQLNTEVKMIQNLPNFRYPEEISLNVNPKHYIKQNGSK